MAFAGFVAAGIVFAIFVRGHEIATRSGAVLVDCAVSVATDSSGQCDAFVLMFDLGSLHAAVCGIEVYSQFDGDFPDAVDLGLAPIKGNAEMSAAGTTAQARMLF